MASSAYSLLLAPPHFSCHIAAPVPTVTPGLSPATAVVRIRSWRRFAAERYEVSLIPARWLRALPRRLNALRDRAPLLLVENKLRTPNHRACDSRRQLYKDHRPLVGGTGEFRSTSSVDRQEPQSGCLEGQTLSDLDENLGICGVLDAVRSGKVDGENNVDGDAEENHLRGTGPVFSSIYEDSYGNMVHVEVDEDEIISKITAAEGEKSCYLQSVFSSARALSKGFEIAQCKVPKNSSFSQFKAVWNDKSHVVDAEVSVVQRNETSLQAVTWSGFAALCGVFFVFAASKLIWRIIKAHLSWKVFDTLRPGLKAGVSDKGNIKVHKFPGDLLGRPRLERSELIYNIKRAKESREGFSLRNLFSFNTVANYYYANIAEIRRMVTDVHTLEEGILEQRSKTDCVVFSHPVAAIKEEVSTSYGRKSVYLVDELPDINFPNDSTKERMEQFADLKNGAPVVDIGVKIQNAVGKIELPEPTYNDERTADTKDVTFVIYAVEKDTHICSEDNCNVCPNSINTPPSEFIRKEQCIEIGVKNLDHGQGIKPSMPFSSDKQILCTKDNAYQISEIAPETADDLSSYITSCGFKNNETSLAITANDLNYVQEIEAPKTFARDAQTAHCKEFPHSVSIMTDILPAKSLQKIREEPARLMRNNTQSMQEREPSNWDDKDVRLANEKLHKINIVYSGTDNNLEADDTETIGKVSTSSLHAPKEETVEHKGATNSIHQKQEKISSPSKNARACLSKRKGKLQRVISTDKVPKSKTKLPATEGAPGTSTALGLSNGVEKTKRVAHKRLKKVQGATEIVAAQDVLNINMVDQKNNSQNAKRTGRKNNNDAFRTQGAQTGEKFPETVLMGNSHDDDAPRIENKKPLGKAGSSAGTPPPKDTYKEPQPNGFSFTTVGMEELKPNFQTFEMVEAAEVETKINIHGAVMHHRSTDFNNSKRKIGLDAVKKSTKRKSSKHIKPSNSVSNKAQRNPPITDAPPNV